MKYRITKSFIFGLLEGMEFTDLSPVPFEVGKIYRSTGTKSKFIVTKCEEIKW